MVTNMYIEELKQELAFVVVSNSLQHLTPTLIMYDGYKKSLYIKFYNEWDHFLENDKKEVLNILATGLRARFGDGVKQVMEFEE